MADQDRARRIGRRLGIAVHALIIGGFTAVCGTEILIQVWAPDGVDTDLGCHEAIQGLFRAVERARDAAARVEGERAALSAFRGALGPEWDARPAVDDHCATDPTSHTDLTMLDRLRYAEERAVRDEASNLARLRREAAARLGQR